MQDLRNAAVVITGASSGIGRATALAFARCGARLALAARREAVLQELAQQCERAGAPRAIAVPTDVADPQAVEALARAAEQAFGRIDAWINNAGMALFGAYADAGIEKHRQVIETNLLGAMHGASAVLPVFLRQGRGVLVNTVSMAGWAPMPFTAAYTASKFGLRGFAASLRQELRDRPDIHVCGVFPAAIDTPIFERSANVSGRAIDPGPLLWAPEDVADTIVAVVRRPRGEVAVGWPARAAQVAYGLAPGPVEHSMGVAMHEYMRRAGPAPTTDGALMQPIPQGTSPDGGWRARKGIPGRSPGAGAGWVLAALAVGAVAALVRARPSRGVAGLVSQAIGR